ncbi:MAG: methylenetetrahydrofolate reductase [NAD(P)H] [Oceanicaulis sp.]
MTIAARFAPADRSPIKVSFEFFPPKNEDMEARLWESIGRLEPLNPHFVSVTYGAGGSTRDRTHRTVRRIVKETGMKPAAHLTCVSATKDEINSVIRDYWDAGVRHIVALRGDPPEGIGEKYVPHEGGYANASDLAAGIKAIGDFEISVGCYPEKHPESPDYAYDIDLLKKKIDNGATRAITQFFFEADTYFRYVERVRKAGIDIPIVPGIMLQPNFKGLKRMAGMCGSSMPDWMDELYDGLEDDPKTRELVTAHVAAELVSNLAEGGADQFHLYTLNRADLALSTCALLGVKPESEKIAA